MSPKTANWIVAAGALLMFIGLLMLPAAFGEHPDADMRDLGASQFSLGALVMATGVYVKARLTQAALAPGEGKKESAPSTTRVRGGCDLCGTEVPMVQCKIHQLHLCGTCLGQHYDVRSCSYIPTTRVTSKGSRNLATKARAGA
jgi:hypothetical protein